MLLKLINWFDFLHFTLECVCFVFLLVVTGSTDGIGKEYAKQLASRGINIVLIARNESKLIQTSREIGKKTSKMKRLRWLLCGAFDLLKEIERL